MARKSEFQYLRFVGLALGGGKTDRTCLAVMDYYPDQKKAFLSHVIEKIQSKDEQSADQILFELLTQKLGNINTLVFNVPLTLPKCMRCRLTCPGYEKCKEPEISWLWKNYRKRNTKKRPGKLFTPYTERCAEFYVSTALEEEFHPPHALGANHAPLVARAHFIRRRLKGAKALEVYPRLSLWRIGRSLSVQKSYLRHHKNSVEGAEIRRAIVERLSEKNVAFLYQQDMNTMARNAQAFDAFMCAFTGILKHLKQCEAKPAGYPKSEGWIEIPKVSIDWGFK